MFWCVIKLEVNKNQMFKKTKDQEASDPGHLSLLIADVLNKTLLSYLFFLFRLNVPISTTKYGEKKLILHLNNSR